MNNRITRAWIDEDEVIRCLSQVCTDDCPRIKTCETVVSLSILVDTERGNGNMSDIIMVDGVQYRKVARKAEVGERVRVVGNVSIHGFNIGDTVTCIDMDEFIDTDGIDWFMVEGDYNVLEPVSIALPSVNHTKISVKITKVYGDSIIPRYQTEGAAGFDLHAYIPDYDAGLAQRRSIQILPGDRKLIGTGIRVQIPEGYEIQLRPRSGLALKRGITLTNSPGTIDFGFTGEIGVILENRGEGSFIIRNGDRICQGVLQAVPIAEFIEVDALDESERGERGFGSTNGVSE